MRAAIAIIFCGAIISLQAQSVSPAIGLRLGGLSGVTFKYVDDNLRGFEIIAGGKDGGLVLTGMVQRYKPLATGRTDGLFVFIGGGAHAGYGKYTEGVVMVVDGNSFYTSHQRTSPLIGADFITGIAYHFESIPLHLSLDYKPYMEFFGRQDFRLDLWDLGFSIKYAINQ